MAVISRIVLAAGRGRRLGQTKPLARLGRARIIERIAALELPPDSETICVTGHDADRVGEVAQSLGMRVVVNEAFETGQTGSLKIGLAACSTGCSGALLHPVDFALIEQADYDSCLTAWDRVCSEERRLVVTSFDRRRGHPLLFTRDLFPEFAALGDDEPARLIVHRHADRIVHVERPDDRILFDIDTAEDLQEAGRRLAQTDDA